MRNSRRLREVYAELKRCVSPETPSGDLLRLAHHIINSYAEDDEKIDLLSNREGRKPFFSLPVDVAMNDGGWHIYFFERKLTHTVDDFSRSSLYLLHGNLNKLLGDEWQRLIPPG